MQVTPLHVAAFYDSEWDVLLMAGADIQLKDADGRRAIDIALLREAVDLGDLGGVYHIDGQKNPCDPLTKAANQCKATMPILVRLLYSGLSPLH